MDGLNELYKEYFGKYPENILPMAASGSNRKYYRLISGDFTSIGVVGTSVDENSAFYNFAKLFKDKKLNVPSVYTISSDRTRYIQEDLGDTSLYDILKRGRDNGGKYNEIEEAMLKNVIRELPRLQFEVSSTNVFEYCYPQKEFDRRGVMFDLNYFKYCFLKLIGVEFNEYQLEIDFEKLSSDLLSESFDTFLYRDFQSRNVMIKNGLPYFIDFQGGRKGPIYYDVASFLWQSSALYSDELRNNLIDVYLNSLIKYKQIDRNDFVEKLNLFVLFRMLQVLGAYGYRGLWEKKEYFINSIPKALDTICVLIKKGILENYPTLKSIVQEILKSDKSFIRKNETNYEINKIASSDLSNNNSKFAPLTVRVFSFSFKKGIPSDDSGNGGGYVFDCRSTNNPGRYERYKTITGLDLPVREFLEEDGEVIDFLESVCKLADFHVKRYIERGFTNLMFSFGCTGGQHRSVYCADYLSHYINDKYGIEVKICHREQNINSVLLPKIPNHKKHKPLKAVVFAAGLGTRLKPLTDTMPKALVPIQNKPLLQILLEKFKSEGFDDVVINVHHFSEQIIDYLRNNNSFGMNVKISDEQAMILETGGGLKMALPLFERQESYILTHNVDILSNVSLNDFFNRNQHRTFNFLNVNNVKPLAILLVSKRETTRYLLFNDDNLLVGWINTKTGEIKSPYNESYLENCNKYAFSGIQMISPVIHSLMENRQGKFSIIDFYISICNKYPICCDCVENLKLLDVGKIETLEKANIFLSMK